MQTETWYVLKDGAVVSPSEVSPGKDGGLVHKSGVAVAMRGDVPSTRSVDPEAESAKAKKVAPKQAGRQMEADGAVGVVGYKTR